ncbi:hypothetical protein D9M68_765540 [compost metagenome]
MGIEARVPLVVRAQAIDDGGKEGADDRDAAGNGERPVERGRPGISRHRRNTDGAGQQPQQVSPAVHVAQPAQVKAVRPEAAEQERQRDRQQLGLAAAGDRGASGCGTGWRGGRHGVGACVAIREKRRHTRAGRQPLYAGGRGQGGEVHQQTRRATLMPAACEQALDKGGGVFADMRFAVKDQGKDPHEQDGQR